MRLRGFAPVLLPCQRGGGVGDVFVEGVHVNLQSSKRSSTLRQTLRSLTWSADSCQPRSLKLGGLYAIVLAVWQSLRAGSQMVGVLGQVAAQLPP